VTTVREEQEAASEPAPKPAHVVKGIRGTGILLLLLANDQSGADVPDMQAEDHLPPRRPQAGRSGRMHWPLRSGMKS